MRLRNIATIYVFDHERILLMHRVGSRLFKGDIWVGAGGHFEEAEMNDPVTCVLRELREETGLTPADIEPPRLKYITTRLAGDEIRQQYIFFAALKTKNPVLIPCEEGELHWIPATELFDRKMGLSNTRCLAHYLSGEKDNTIYHCAATEQDGGLAFRFAALAEYSADH